MSEAGAGGASLLRPRLRIEPDGTLGRKTKVGQYGCRRERGAARIGIEVSAAGALTGGFRVLRRAQTAGEGTGGTTPGSPYRAREVAPGHFREARAPHNDRAFPVR